MVDDRLMSKKKLTREQEKAMFAKNHQGSSYHTRDKYQSSHAKRIDRSLNAKKQYPRNHEGIQNWKQEPNRSDVKGIDDIPTKSTEREDKMKRLKFAKKHAPERYKKEVESGNLKLTESEKKELEKDDKVKVGVNPDRNRKNIKENQDYTPGKNKNQLTNHTNENNAYIVDDYPYGRYRTKMRYWIETNKTHGDRVCRQSLNPKTDKWNNPKKSTYSEVMVLKKNPSNGHVETDSLSTWAGEERIKEFMNKYELNEQQKKRCKQLIILNRASKHIKYEIKPHDPNGPSHEETQKKNQEIWNRAIAYEHHKAKKNNEI